MKVKQALRKDPDGKENHAQDKHVLSEVGWDGLAAGWLLGAQDMVPRHHSVLVSAAERLSAGRRPDGPRWGETCVVNPQTVCSHAAISTSVMDFLCRDWDGWTRQRPTSEEWAIFSTWLFSASYTTGTSGEMHVERKYSHIWPHSKRSVHPPTSSPDLLNPNPPNPFLLSP